MRSIRELLQLMLSEWSMRFDRITIDGLCLLVDDMSWHNKCISCDERELLKEYIKEHKPFNPFAWIRDYYHWYPGRERPRKRWLKRHIRKLKRLERN